MLVAGLGPVVGLGPCLQWQHPWWHPWQQQQLLRLLLLLWLRLQGLLLQLEQWPLQALPLQSLQRLPQLVSPFLPPLHQQWLLLLLLPRLYPRPHPPLPP